jgi:hypothetical protein
MQCQWEASNKDWTTQNRLHVRVAMHGLAVASGRPLQCPHPLVLLATPSFAWDGQVSTSEAQNKVTSSFRSDGI